MRMIYTIIYTQNTEVRKYVTKRVIDRGKCQLKQIDKLDKKIEYNREVYSMYS